MRSATRNLKFLDDLARVASGAVQSMGDVRGQVKTMVTGFLSELDLVTRAEYERVEAMAQKALERQTTLEKRLTALEKTLAGGKTALKKRKKKK